MPQLINPEVVVKPLPKNVSELFSENFKVPENQRDFAWRRKQIEQFFDDLFEHFALIATANVITRPKGYFIGSTVVMSEGGTNASLPLAIVDGQQRTTILSIAAAVLKDLISRQRPEGLSAGKVAAKNQPALIGLAACLTTYSGGELVPRLSFSDVETDEAFRRYIINSHSRFDVKQAWGSLKPSQKKKNSPNVTLHDAYKTTYRKLLDFLRSKRLRPAERYELLLEFTRMFLECIVVLQIKTFSVENTYAIFQSLNDRGLSLSQADLIKNELLRFSGQQTSDVIDSWQNSKQILLNLDEIDMPELIQYSYLSRFGEVKAKKLFSTVKDDLGKGKFSAIDFVGYLETDAENLELLVRNGAGPSSRIVNEYLDEIVRVLGHRMSYPILLVLDRQFRSLSKTDSIEFETSLKFLRNFLFRYMVVGDGSPEGLARIAVEIGAACRENAKNPSDALNAISSIFLTYSSDSSFSADFADVSLTNASQAYFAVSCLENYLSRQAGLQTLPQGTRQNNVEHILPKRPEAYWPAMAALKASNKQEYRNLLWKVGNLMPLFNTVNKKLQDKNIAEKNVFYRGLPAALAQNVSIYLDNGEWTERSIEGRQRYFASISHLVWPLV